MGLVQEHTLHATISWFEAVIDIRNEFHLLLKKTIASDVSILENVLLSAVSMTWG